MTATSSKTGESSRREWLIILALTVVGGLFRLGAVGRSGLTHFDEGIYALAGGWVFQASGIDAGLIPYAPPLYVILVGTAYLLLGASDVAAILVSTVAGTLTIPVVGWLGRRHFGAGAGMASAVLAAFALPHMVFSRMALTDATFLLAWLIALGAGSLFVERPGLLRGIGLGLAVGLAQLAKYNGWLAGGIVLASSVWDLAVEPERRTRRSLLRVFGFGLVAAVVAALVYAPWFRFVERHGGYAGLLAHQRSYLGGFASWPGHLVDQFRQESALAGPLFFIPLFMLVGVGPHTRLGPARDAAMKPWPMTVALCALIAGGANPNFGWTLALLLAPITLFKGSARLRFLAWAWAIPAILTPFYHPYARLWLPVSALGWLAAGGLVAVIRRWEPSVLDLHSSMSPHAESGRLRTKTGYVLAGLVVAGSVGVRLLLLQGTTESYGANSRPTDDLRTATRALIASLPPDVRSVQILARPPVMFYLAGRVGSRRLPDAASLARDDWAVIDEVQIRQEPDGENRLKAILASWTVVRVEENTPGPATLLDVDPAYAGKGSPPPKFKLWLIRP